MRAALILIMAALAIAGCGGDDDEPASPTTTAEESAAHDITVEAFIAELQPEKQQILKEFVADSEACDGVKVDPGFVLLVTAAASDADPNAPLADVVEEQCG